MCLPINWSQNTEFLFQAISEFQYTASVNVRKIKLHIEPGLCNNLKIKLDRIK